VKTELHLKGGGCDAVYEN